MRCYININPSQGRPCVSRQIIHFHQELQLYLLGALDGLGQGQGGLVESSLQTEGGLGQGRHAGRGVDVDHSQRELGRDLLVLRVES